MDDKPRHIEHPMRDEKEHKHFIDWVKNRPETNNTNK